MCYHLKFFDNNLAFEVDLMFISVIQVHRLYLNSIKGQGQHKGSTSIGFTPMHGLSGRMNQAMLDHMARSTSF